ncbi:hypothetical protein DO65_5954 [Burkholderia pseudomallei]|nr:hypothetical protein DO65_5954 [Burkholderia pseudomallei]
MESDGKRKHGSGDARRARIARIARRRDGRAVAHRVRQRQRGLRMALAGDALGKAPPRGAADLAIRRRDARERRREQLADREAVEAEHRHVVGHREVRVAQPANHDHREPVVAAEERGGARRACAQMREHRVRQRGCIEVELERGQRFEPALVECLRIAVHAQPRAIGCVERAREHQHAPMAALDQHPHAVVRGAAIVDRHRRAMRRVVVHQHVERAVAVELVEQRVRVGVGDGEHQPFHALRAQCLDRMALARRIVFGRHHDQLEAGLRREFVDALQAFGEYGIRERRQHDADQLRAVAAQLPAERIRAKAQRADRRADLFERRRMDGVRRVDRARHGGDRKAGERGDVFDGGRHEAGSGGV